VTTGGDEVPGAFDGPDGEAGVRARMVARLRTGATTGVARADSTLAAWRRRSAAVDTVAAIVERDRASFGTVVGSAIALRMFVFLLPATLFLVGLLAIVGGELDPDAINEDLGVTATIADTIATAMTQETTAGWIALGVGAVGMATGGRSLARVMVAGSTLAWNAPLRRGGVLRVMRVVVLVVLALIVSATIVNRIRLTTGVALSGATILVAAAVYIVLFAVLMVVLPTTTRDPGSALPGAVLAGISMAAMQAFTQLYVAQRFGGVSDLYGALGSAAVLVGWLFVFGRILTLAFAVNAVLHERYGSVSQLFFGLPVIRILPQRVAVVRRIFDLDPDGGDQPTL
jgi:uncharacterized BrkB/YihY/UPF0761 family membrane protein